MNPFEQHDEDRFRITYYRNIDKKGLVGIFGLEVKTDWINLRINDMALKRNKSGEFYIDFPKRKYTNKEGNDDFFPILDASSPKDQYISYRNQGLAPIMRTLQKYFDENQGRGDLNGQDRVEFGKTGNQSGYSNKSNGGGFKQADPDFNIPF